MPIYRTQILALAGAAVLLSLAAVAGLPGQTSKETVASSVQAPTGPSASATPPPTRPATPAPSPSVPPCTPPPGNGRPGSVALDNGGGFLDLPTYDGSNQLTHLNVVFDPDGYLGHRYWMVMTPYPFGDDSKENPSILVSQNGLDWAVPAGLTNPVAGPPPDVDQGGHYSDGVLLRQPDGFDLYFRYNPAKQGGNKPDNSTNLIYRMTSRDGINWSDKQTIFEGGPDPYVSPAVERQGSRFRLWYTMYDGRMVHRESPDLLTWTDPQPVEAPLTDGYNPWHQEIIKTDQGYEALLLGNARPEPGKPTFALFYAKSTDGLRFEQASRIDPAKVDPRLAGYHFYKSALVKHCGTYQLFLSAVAPDGAYRSFYKQVPVESLADLFTD
jgi:hypothetical protein